MLFKLSDTAKKLVLVIAVICAVLCAAVFAARLSPAPDYVLGLLLGSAFAMHKVIMMERVLERSFDMEPQQAEIYAKSRFILRYFLTGAILVLAAILPHVDFFAAVVGVFTLHPAAYIVSFLTRNDGKNEIKAEKG